MHVESKLRKFLLDPVLDGTLSAPLDRFILKTREGDVSMAAHISCMPDQKGFSLELRDENRRDLGQFFTQKNKCTPEDGIQATGWLDGRFPIVIPCLVAPTKSEMVIIGNPEVTRAWISHREIRIPRHRTDPGFGADAPDAEDAGTVSYSHLAILKDTQLQMVNKGIQVMMDHPFFGRTGSENQETWFGDVMGGECCLHQVGGHLEIHLRRRCQNDDEATNSFRCLMDAVCLIHNTLPWPTFRQHWREECLMGREIALHGLVSQGSFHILRKNDTYGDPTAGSLLGCLTELFFAASPERRKRLRRLLWVFRGADSASAPFPTQLLGVCTVVEGLFHLLLEHVTPPPPDFLDLQSEAIELAAGLRPGNPFATHLVNHIKRWRFQSRRSEWHSAFDPLFPGKQSWLDELFRIFNNYRHGLAHGSFDRILTKNSHGDVDALSRLAGFVNLTFAAMAGFKGTLLEGPFSNDRVSIGE